MFTGIVEEVGQVILKVPDKLTVRAQKVLEGLKLGDSIAVNGACLTITNLDKSSFTVDLMPETLRQTNLGLLNYGDEVDLERPLSLGSRLGGHLVQGHVDSTGRVTLVKPEGEAKIMGFKASDEVMRYIVKKGFVAVDGVSLTVTDLNQNSFQVSLVQSSQRNTILGARKIGDLVNLEVDIMAKYAERFTQTKNEGITTGFLEEHGFLAR